MQILGNTTTINVDTNVTEYLNKTIDDQYVCCLTWLK